MAEGAPEPGKAVESPFTLADACTDLIAANVRSNLRGLGHPDRDLFMHAEVAEALVERISARGDMDDEALAHFTAAHTRLSRVRITDASKLTTRGLRVLRDHNISDLEARGLARATITDLIGSLGDWTVANVRTFNVAESTFLDANKHAVMVPMSRLKSVTTLIVSGTEFNRTSLDMVVDDLPHLERIDISCTKVTEYSALRRIRHRLKHLDAHDVKISQAVADAAADWLPEMTELVHLDISVEAHSDYPFSPPFNHGKISTAKLLLRDPNVFPKMRSLDLSGKDDVQAEHLLPFLEAHPRLRFLGLSLTEACADDAFVEPENRYFNKDLVVTGNATIGQVQESLKRYMGRMHYVQKSLYQLFRHTQGLSEPKKDLIDLVVRAAQMYNMFAIQMAATACLFNLSKSEIGQKLHPRLLGRIVAVDLNAMESYPQHLQLQKNVLLTICTDRILQDVSFDRYRCSRLVLNCLCSYDEESMKRMSVAIISILAARISTQETSRLGSEPNYMKKLLELVRHHVTAGQVNITLKFTLSALWNLTDESPSTCSVFLGEGGMALFLLVLSTFPNDVSIETKVLGLLNNIAEVRELRDTILVDGFISQLRRLMHSDHIDVSYFAAGIVAHLASSETGGGGHWPATIECTTRDEILQDLFSVVSEWKTPEEEMVAYRSFRPFFPLMAPAQPFPVQMWASWAIHHVCSKNATRYCPMLVEQGGADVIKRLLSDNSTQMIVLELCESIAKSLFGEGLISQG